MNDDLRIKRVVKRYRKGSDFPDASFELVGFTLAELQDGFGYSQTDPIYSPRELGEEQIDFLRARLGYEFDMITFDFFLHPYVRAEYVKDFFADTSRDYRGSPAPEGGLPQTIAPDKVWFSVRPRDGREQFIARDRSN